MSRALDTHDSDTAQAGEDSLLSGLCLWIAVQRPQLNWSRSSMRCIMECYRLRSLDVLLASGERTPSDMSRASGRALC
jgi:isopentenyl diphosphate isomerase/L-lactate dehydrogenase-like FMN-dependent dehydrogenase